MDGEMDVFIGVMDRGWNHGWRNGDVEMDGQNDR